MGFFLFSVGVENQFSYVFFFVFFSKNVYVKRGLLVGRLNLEKHLYYRF